jgi:uncharacterized membrane protein YqgA involved in biofilm formation
MLGTLYNVITVAVGSSIGLVLGQRVPDGMRKAVFSALGLFTLFMGVDMMMDITRPMAAFMALVLGAIVGHLVGLDARVKKAADRLGKGEGAALVQSTLLFCIGAMTLVGCMQDGLLGDPTVLMAKGTMDLFSSIFLAAALGRGVLWSTGSVLVIQGGLTFAFATAGAGIPDPLVGELSGVGGILLLALGLDLLDIRKFPLLDLTWSLPLLPLILSVLDALTLPF